MCEACTPGPLSLSRRRFGLIGAAGAAELVSLAAVSSRAAALSASPGAVPRPEILPREMWAQGRAPKGEIPVEEPRFLLVHHTAEPGNGYRSEDVPGLLQGIFDYHTGSAKGWPDVAYNFFIDKDGRIWEGRQGSIAGPVRGSATGGNQGWSQLCCFLGNFEAELPSQAAQESMVSLLAWLGDRYSIDTSPGATVELESLGSNRWPEGTTITTSTIAGHRDMSMTTCPGDSAYAWVTSTLPADVSALRLAQAPPTTTSSLPPTTASTPTTAPNPTEPESADGAETVDSSPRVAPTDSISDSGDQGGNADDESVGGMSGPTKAALAAGAVLAAGAGATGLVRARRGRDHSTRHVGPHWVLSVDSSPSSGQPGDGGSDHIGTDGVIAWAIHGGWPTEAAGTAIVDLVTSAPVSGLRTVCADLVKRLGPSPDCDATIVLFMAETGDPGSASHVLGLGRGQISVQSATGSELFSYPVDASFPEGSSFLIRLGEGAAEVRAEPAGTGVPT